MSDFKSGDLVEHTTGGPKMVVVSPAWKRTTGSDPKVLCRWWTNPAFSTEAFRSEELKPSK